MSKANKKQIDGIHYKKMKIEPWDFIIDNNLGYLEGSAIKYITRWKDKGGIKDLEKAIHFIQKLIETEKGKDDEVLEDMKESVESITNSNFRNYELEDEEDSIEEPMVNPDTEELGKEYINQLRMKDNYEEMINNTDMSLITYLEQFNTTKE